MLVTSVSLAAIAELPGPDVEYKFQHWSGDEIYPDEEEEYRAKAASTECYFLRLPDSNSQESGSTGDPSTSAGCSDSTEKSDHQLDGINQANPILTVIVPLSEEWKDHIGRDFFHQIDHRLKIEPNNWKPPMEESRRRTYMIEDAMKSKLKSGNNAMKIQLQEQIENAIFTSLKPYFFDKLGTVCEVETEVGGNSKSNSDVLLSYDFIKNNFGATCKYQIIDGWSRKILKFGDHETPLWLLFNGAAKEFGPEKLVFEIKWKSIYLSNYQFCGINRPWYL